MSSSKEYKFHERTADNFEQFYVFNAFSIKKEDK